MDLVVPKGAEGFRKVPSLKFLRCRHRHYPTWLLAKRCAPRS